MYYIELRLEKILKAIKTNDGFPGPIPPDVRAVLVGRYAEPEVSPLTGLDMHWKLTAEGKKKLKEIYAAERRAEKRKEYEKRHPFPGRTPEAPIPLTIEVLDALKAIRETGSPQTDKLTILAHLQRRGPGGEMAKFVNGVWSLTERGEHVEAGHIRKSECAQFTGKVR